MGGHRGNWNGNRASSRSIPKPRHCAQSDAKVQDEEPLAGPTHTRKLAGHFLASGQKRATWKHSLKIPENIWNILKHSETFWNHMKNSENIWTILNNLNKLWKYLTNSDNIWNILKYLITLKPSCCAANHIVGVPKGSIHRIGHGLASTEHSGWKPPLPRATWIREILAEHDRPQRGD